jgi:hypothetical protein
MFKFAFHYVQRFKELGLVGTLQRVRTRIKNMAIQWSQTWWWGWRARREMNDAGLLARTTGGWQSMDALLDHLASRPASSFILPHESSQKTAILLKQFYPDHVPAILASADAACRNKLSLLGQVFHFSKGIDWQCDPVTGWCWPPLHRTRLDRYLGSTRPVDLIFFWELNRHQHFITLGIAYWLTGDQRYVDAFSSQIESWIETNPIQKGVNWYYPLEVSIRLIAWTVAFQFFRGSQEFRAKIGRAFLKSLWHQADFLSTHLQITRFDIPNNHLMAELTGLVLVGAAFPEFRSSAAWRETGLHLLTQQATAQTHSDGVNKEQAIGYHRFVAELLLLIVVRCHQGALPHEPILEETLERMLEYVLFTLTPVGTTPMWGDSDYGRALGLEQNKDFWDFRPILSAGAALFGRPDWKFAASRLYEWAFWLLGSKGLDAWEELDCHPPEKTSHGFPQAGMYVIRDAWAADTDVAFFRCGQFGLGGEGHCAHAHCDLLSFVLWLRGHLLLVDSGTYIYHGAWRDYFRLTAAHNTVKVDGREQAIPRPNFNWQQIPEAKCINWAEERVTGALTYSSQVEFFRELIHPRPGVWELCDKFKGHDRHSMEWFFHFAPGLDLQQAEADHIITVIKEGRAFLTVNVPHNGIHCQIRDDWYSYQYGVKQPNRGLYARWQGELNGEGVSFNWQFCLVNERPQQKGGLYVAST